MNKEGRRVGIRVGDVMVEIDIRVIVPFKDEGAIRQGMQASLEARKRQENAFYFRAFRRNTALCYLMSF